MCPGYHSQVTCGPPSITFLQSSQCALCPCNRIEQELHHLETAGIIERVEFDEWAAPIVPVSKPDGSVRICEDYKTTVNRVAKLDPYPIPRVLLM